MMAFGPGIGLYVQEGDINRPPRSANQLLLVGPGSKRKQTATGSLSARPQVMGLGGELPIHRALLCAQHWALYLFTAPLF